MIGRGMARRRAFASSVSVWAMYGVDIVIAAVEGGALLCSSCSSLLSQSSLSDVTTVGISTVINSPTVMARSMLTKEMSLVVQLREEGGGLKDDGGEVEGGGSTYSYH